MQGGTRSGLAGCGKRGISGEFLKMKENTESNQKWSGVKARVGVNAGNPDAATPLPNPESELRSSRPHKGGGSDRLATHASFFPSPPVGEGGRDAQRRGRVRGIVSTNSVPADRTPHPARTASAPPSPTRGEGKKRRGIKFPYCVFATLGGVAVVTNWVASSMAWPNGVGSVMRKGTSTRVPAIGTKAISMFRWAARYLMIGRSGM